MPTGTLTCPRCSCNLTTTKAFDVGSRFRCPACGVAFAARPQDVTSQPVRRAAPRRSPLHEQPPSRAGAWLVLAGVMVLALLLMGGAGLALALHFLGPKHDDAPVAAKSIPKIPASAAPFDRPPPQPAPEPPPQSELPPERQENVTAAIQRGIDYLDHNQYGDGTWGTDHQTGLAGLPGLTLMECGVPTDNPKIQKAARFIRDNAPGQGKTYELALAILFLDRLGDPADEPLIRTLALRLLAGQKASGGWTYDCPILSENDERGLGTVLEATRPRSSLDLTAAAKPGGVGIDSLFTSRRDDGAVGAAPPGALGPARNLTEEDKQKAREMYNGLSPAVKGMPILKPTTANDVPLGDGTDNSNTQFATLGLWAAGRHRVPTERALVLLSRRFQLSQTPNGGWAYNYAPHPGGGEGWSMTGAGLLGLAVGHGVTADLKGQDVEAAGQDPQVEKGMKCFSGFIDPHHGYGLYFLWSVERVGMLYGRKTIGDKEWYPIGLDFLLPQQKPDGHWQVGLYPGATSITDTCFALLFLKRANLAKDLSSKVQFLTPINR